MVSRFWRAGGNALRPDCNFLADVAATSAIWNGSSDTPASSADWFRSNGNLTALRNSTGGGFWAELFGSTAKANGTIIVTVDALSGGSFPLYIGFGDAATTNAPGVFAGNSISYAADGSIRFQAGVDQSGLGTLGAGDKLKITKAGSVFTFYKWNGSSWVQQGVPKDTSIDAPSMAGNLYPIVSNGNATGTQVTLDANGW